MAASASQFAPVLQAYQSFDPAGWVGVYRYLPTWAGIMLVLLGGVLLLAGGGRAFRLVAGPMGALVGTLWIPVVARKFEMDTNPAAVSLGAAVLLAAVGFAFPPAAVFFAFGLPAGLLAGQLAGPSDWLLGFLPGLIVFGMIALALARYVGAVASSLVGGWLVVIGLLAALHQVGGLVEVVSAQPWGAIIAAALFATAGAVYQLAVNNLTPEEAAKLKEERIVKRRRLEEQKALEKRWAAYSDRGEKD